MSRNYPLNPKHKKRQSDRRPRKVNLVMWDEKSDTEKVIRRNMTEDSWAEWCWANEHRHPRVLYSGRAVPAHNKGGAF